MSEDEKEIKREYHRNKYHNMNDEEKQKYKDYQKKYGEAKYHNMNDEEKQKYKDYQKEYRKAHKDKKLEYYKNNIELMKKKMQEKDIGPCLKIKNK